MNARVFLEASGGTVPVPPDWIDPTPPGPRIYLIYDRAVRGEWMRRQAFPDELARLVEVDVSKARFDIYRLRAGDEIWFAMHDQDASSAICQQVERTIPSVRFTWGFGPESEYQYPDKTFVRPPPPWPWKKVSTR